MQDNRYTIKVAYDTHFGGGTVAIHPVDPISGHIDYPYVARFCNVAAKVETDCIPNHFILLDKDGEVIGTLWDAREARPNEDLH